MKAKGVTKEARKGGIEIAGLDLSEYHGRYLDEAEVYAAEVKEARARGLIND